MNPRFSQVGPSIHQQPRTFSAYASPSRIFVRGLPYRVNASEVQRFFAPLWCNVFLGSNSDGRPSGDAIVEFQSPVEAKQAFAKNGQMIGHRYLELFPSMTMTFPPGTQYNFSGGSGYKETGQFDWVDYM